MRKRRDIRFIAAIVLFVLAGCGGGGGGGPAAGNDLAVAIHWGARTRALQGPSSALSVKITVIGARLGGGDVWFIVNRDPNPAEYTATSKSGTPAREGNYILRAEFYSLADGLGDQVGNAQAAVRVGAGVPLQGLDGNPLPAISTTGTISTVRVLPDQLVAVGRDHDLEATAYGKNGSVLAVTPGSFRFIQSTGSPGYLAVDPSGLAHGLQVGFAGVTASVDGVASHPESVLVTPDATFRFIALTVTDLAWDPVSQRIYAGVASTEGSNRANSIAVISPTNASVDRFIPVGGEPGKIAVTDDGQYLYVALPALGAVRRISLNSGQADLLIPVGWPEVPTPGLINIAAVAQAPHSIAVDAAGPGIFLNQTRVAVYDDGIVRPDVVGSTDGAFITSIAFGGDGSRLYGVKRNGPDDDLASMSVDSAGVHLVGVSSRLLGPPQSDGTDPIQFVGGRIYSSNGRVIDPIAATVLGTFPLYDGFSPETPVVIDAAAGHAYYFSGWPGIVQTFDTAQFAQSGKFCVTAHYYGLETPRIVRWARGSIAVSFKSSDAGNKIVIISGLTD